MRWSIRTRMLLATNLLVAGLGLVVGWLGITVAGREIERKLVDEVALHVAGQIGMNRWPLTDDLMQRVGQMLGDEAAVGPVARAEIVASSLDSRRRGELLAAVARTPLPRHVTLGGRQYRVATATIPQTDSPGTGGAMRLCLLVPVERIVSAKAHAARTIALATAAAVAFATVVSVWWSHSITRPLRDLASRMDRLSRAAAEMDMDALLASELSPSGDGHKERGNGGRGGMPPEIARLTESYEGLMGQLAEARSRLARSARMATLGQMSAAVAHELRNPLSGIKMNARVLADELSRHGLHDESLDIIRREIDRMEAYLNDLLGLAVQREEPAEVSQRRTAVRLEELVDSVVTLLEERLRDRSVAVEKHYERGAPAAWGDAGRVRQVILNLSLNALEAMPSGGTLGLAVEGCSEGVRLSVSDTGGGVRVSDGTDIFEPFVTSKRGGTGLGLHVCRSIVEHHGGRIGYASSEQGSTFWIILPGAKG